MSKAKKTKIKKKVHKSTAKRFKVTGSGVVTRVVQRLKNNAHKKNKRSSKRRVDKDKLELAKPEQKRVKELLGIKKKN